MAEDAWSRPGQGDGGNAIPENGAPGDNEGWGNSGGQTPPGGRRMSPPPSRRSRSRSPRRNGDGGGSADGATNPGNNLHVSGLSMRVETRHLEDAFGKFGRVQKASVMYDPHSRESRGFGFVTMETAAEAEAAMTGLAGTELEGKVISIQKARRGRARTPTPGNYKGPPKRDGNYYDRPYDPRPYDSRYSERRPGGYGNGGSRGYEDDRRGGRYDERDRYGGGGRYDDRRDYDRRDYDRRDYERRDYERRDYPPREYDRRY